MRQLLEQTRREAEAAEARGNLLPSVQGQAAEIRHKINFEALAGEPLPGFPRVVGPFSIRSFAAQAQVPLLDLSLWRRWRSANSMTTAAQAETGRIKEEISALVVGQYLLGLRAEAQVRAVGARIELARTLEQLAVHQEQSGVGTGLDTLRAKVRTQTEEQALIRAKTARQEALAGLVRLLDLPPEERISIKPIAETSLPVATGFREDLATATSRRAEFKVIEAQKRAADERVAGTGERVGGQGQGQRTGSAWSITGCH